jgi:cytochrome c553
MHKLVIVMTLVLAAVGSVAQTDDDSTLPCDVAELILMQRNMQEQLESFRSHLSEDPETALAALYDIGTAYQEMALNCGHIPDDVGDLYVGSDLDRIMRVLEEVPGDPFNGQLLYNNIEPAADGQASGCIGCHEQAVTAPTTAGTWTRWDEERRTLDPFANYTFAEYTVESIVDPWAYTVEGYPENTMPNNYGDRLSYQNLADLVAYLESQDQLPE